MPGEADTVIMPAVELRKWRPSKIREFVHSYTVRGCLRTQTQQPARAAETPELRGGGVGGKWSGSKGREWCALVGWTVGEGEGESGAGEG